MILSTPALDALRQQHPDAQIDVVTSPRAQSVIRNHPSVRDVFTFDILQFRNLGFLLSPKRWRQLKQQTAPLRQRQYDVLLSMNNIASYRGALTLGFFLRTLKVPYWIGRNTHNRAPYFDREAWEDLHSDEHEVERRLRVASLLGADPVARPLSLPPLPAINHHFDWPDNPCAALLPFKQDSRRCWPQERFAMVARYLVDEGFAVMVFGGSGDHAAAEQIREIAQRPILNFTGRLSLLETAKALKSCQIGVANDTGPMHLAAATGLPMVVLFDPVHRKRFSPWMDTSRYCVITRPLEKKISERDLVAMVQRVFEEISVEEVISELETLRKSYQDG